MSAVMDHPTQLTWDEFLALPYETRNASLIDGEVVVNAPKAQHEMIVQNLCAVFRLWRREQPGRGETSTQQPVKIHDRRGYQPDFAWYAQEQCAPADEPPGFIGLPRLIAEVLSPSTRSFDLIRKRGDYEKIGIDEVWFVDGDDHKVLICQRPQAEAPFNDIELGEDDMLRSPLLDGFDVPVSDLFER